MDDNNVLVMETRSDEKYTVPGKPPQHDRRQYDDTCISVQVKDEFINIMREKSDLDATFIHSTAVLHSTRSPSMRSVIRVEGNQISRSNAEAEQVWIKRGVYDFECII